ncbi:hypothetical protein [Dictyobacter formicarum]|uniref:Uncharacterized protein n=1 Tax=Dictyobacter formicarum TaxID=2778368 RepID=A0ABQ3VI66_9CHLR|nr:hypothetical protein [Dictyobacter formicarum]GHO85872.1 hypothetical protein KSZ_38780 [Dictyobacter formicarum]
MKFGLDVPTTGTYADAHVLAQLASASTMGRHVDENSKQPIVISEEDQVFCCASSQSKRSKTNLVQQTSALLHQ